ncbi:hypothetical protein HZS_4782 [Henneguya salminicola]|nr:hypothetical protein HZS_4782 [Henneguya salminicola]
MFISQFILLVTICSLILKSCRSNNFDDEEKEASDNVLFYRRFEIIFLNLKIFYDLKCGGSYVGCRLLTDVNIFGISEKRNISLKDEYDETDGIFMVNYAIFDTEDHKKSEK